MNREQLIKLILDFFHQNSLYKAQIALEQDTQTRLWSYGKELDFFYDLIMEGRFDDAEKFIHPLKTRSEFNFKRVIFEVRKEKLLEAVESADNPNLQELVGTLKELESISTKEDFNKLCQLLSLNKLSDNVEYANWNIYTGRVNCFQECLNCLTEIYPVTPYETPDKSLEEFLEIREAAEADSASNRLYKSVGLQKLQPRSRESSRYSLEIHPETRKEEVLEGSFLMQESDNTDKDLTYKSSKKSVSWNMSGREEVSDQVSEEQEKRVFVEALDLTSGADEQSIDEINPSYKPQTSEDLMSRFHPTYLREAARIQDVQPIRACAFNADGDYFVIGTNSKALKICSLQNIVDGMIYNQHQGREQSIDIIMEMKNVHYGSVYCVDWSRSGRQIASGSNDKSIRVIYCPDFLQLLETQGNTVVYCNGKYLTGVADLPPIQERLLVGHSATVRALCFHPLDDRILVSGGIVDPELKVWNTDTGQCVRALAGHKDAIYSIACSGDADIFASVGTDRTLRIWDLRSARCSMVINCDNFSDMNSISLNISSSHLRAETKSRLSNIYKPQRDPPRLNGNLAAVGHCDGVVTIWDITAGKLWNKFNYHTAEVRSVEFSSDSRWIISGSFDSSIGMIDMESGQTYKVEHHSDRVVSARWHPYLPILLSTSADKTARIFSI
jgi:WD40 repeat protein